MIRVFLLLFLAAMCCAQGMQANSKVIPSSDYISMQCGPVTLSIAPQIGGRIASMVLTEQEILKTTRDENNLQWGSTVWVSPQSDWVWPPSKILDSDPYDVLSSTPAAVVVRSKIDPKTGYQITKRFEFKACCRRKEPVAKMTYKVCNRSNMNRKVAVWESTRVLWEGSIKFPAGTKIRLSKPELPIVVSEGKQERTVRLDKRQPNEQKLFCTPPKNGTYTWNNYRSGNLVLVKSTRLPMKVAPEHSPLEIYFAPADRFAELEFQGEYADLAPDDCTTMVVFWRLRKSM